MDNSRDLRVLIASRHPLIVAEVSDEERFLSILRRSADTVGVPLWRWSATKGLARDGTDNDQYMTADCKKALDFVSEIAGPAVFVFADAQHVLEDRVVKVVDRIRQFAPSRFDPRIVEAFLRAWEKRDIVPIEEAPRPQPVLREAL